MSDILTRLLLNTSDYDNKLRKAKGSTQEFGSMIGGKVAGMVGKFAAGIGVAMGGVEAFNKVINSSQETGDAWNNTLNACKGTVDAFFQSLSTGDWGAFNGGLLETLRNMREVSALRDTLSDAKLTMGFDVRQFEREYVRLEGIIDDETKSKGEREKAFAEMQQLISTFRARVEATGRGAAETLVKELNAKFGKDFTLGDVEKYIKEVNNEFLNTETLQRLDKYKEELSKFKPGGSRAVMGGYVMTEEQFKAANAELEKLRILQNDNDENRSRMVSDYEYVLEMQQRAEEYHKRSLEKQNKIAAMNKGTVSSGGGTQVKEQKIPVSLSFGQYETDLGQKVLKWMNGEDVPVIKVPIEIEDEMPDEEDLSGKWGEHVKKIEDMNSALSSTGEIFGSLGSIMGSFGNDMGAWMLGTVGQIAQMIVQLQSLATARAVAEGAKVPFPGNLAAMATVAATIASIFSSLPKFADGGVVGGSSYFGDKLLARVNSGEMILNQKQQSRLLSLTDGGGVRVSGDVRLSGKDIYISLRNYMSASGNKL